MESITKIKTGVDRLVELVRQQKRISVKDAARALSVPQVLIEEWADFLEDKELIGIEYKFTVPYLVYKEMTKHETEEQAKQFAGRREGFVRKVDSVLESLSQEQLGLAKLKREFDSLTKEIQEKVSHAKSELGLMAQYDEAKRSIDTQISQQEIVIEKKRAEMAGHIEASKRALEQYLKQVEQKSKELSDEKALTALLAHEQDELQRKLALILQRSQVVSERVGNSAELIRKTAAKISEYQKNAAGIQQQIEQERREIAPLLKESRDAQLKIEEQKKKFFSKAAMIRSSAKNIDSSYLKGLQARFNSVFSRKAAADELVGRLTADIASLKKELQKLSEDALVVSLSGKSKKITDYVQEYESRFEKLNQKKELFQKELGKLVGMLHSL